MANQPILAARVTIDPRNGRTLTPGVSRTPTSGAAGLTLDAPKVLQAIQGADGQRTIAQRYDLQGTDVNTLNMLDAMRVAAEVASDVDPLTAISHFAEQKIPMPGQPGQSTVIQPMRDLMGYLLEKLNPEQRETLRKLALDRARIQDTTQEAYRYLATTPQRSLAGKKFQQAAAGAAIHGDKVSAFLQEYYPEQQNNPAFRQLVDQALLLRGLAENQATGGIGMLTAGNTVTPGSGPNAQELQTLADEQNLDEAKDAEYALATQGVTQKEAGSLQQPEGARSATQWQRDIEQVVNQAHAGAMPWDSVEGHGAPFQDRSVLGSHDFPLTTSTKNRQQPNSPELEAFRSIAEATGLSSEELLPLVRQLGYHSLADLGLLSTVQGQNTADVFAASARDATGKSPSQTIETADGRQKLINPEREAQESIVQTRITAAKEAATSPKIKALIERLERQYQKDYPGARMFANQLVTQEATEWERVVKDKERQRREDEEPMSYAGGEHDEPLDIYQFLAREQSPQWLQAGHFDAHEGAYMATQEVERLRVAKEIGASPATFQLSEGKYPDIYRQLTAYYLAKGEEHVPQSGPLAGLGYQDALRDLVDTLNWVENGKDTNLHAPITTTAFNTSSPELHHTERGPVGPVTATTAMARLNNYGFRWDYKQVNSVVPLIQPGENADYEMNRAMRQTEARNRAVGIMAHAFGPEKDPMTHKGTYIFGEHAAHSFDMYDAMDRLFQRVVPGHTDSSERDREMPKSPFPKGRGFEGENGSDGYAQYVQQQLALAGLIPGNVVRPAVRIINGQPVMTSAGRAQLVLAPSNPSFVDISAAEPGEIKRERMESLRKKAQERQDALQEQLAETFRVWTKSEENYRQAAPVDARLPQHVRETREATLRQLHEERQQAGQAHQRLSQQYHRKGSQIERLTERLGQLPEPVLQKDVAAARIQYSRAQAHATGLDLIRHRDDRHRMAVVLDMIAQLANIPTLEKTLNYQIHSTDHKTGTPLLHPRTGQRINRFSRKTLIDAMIDHASLSPEHITTAMTALSTIHQFGNVTPFSDKTRGRQFPIIPRTALEGGIRAVLPEHRSALIPYVLKSRSYDSGSGKAFLKSLTPEEHMLLPGALLALRSNFFTGDPESLRVLQENHGLTPQGNQQALAESLIAKGANRSPAQQGLLQSLVKDVEVNRQGDLIRSLQTWHDAPEHAEHNTAVESLGKVLGQATVTAYGPKDLYALPQLVDRWLAGKPQPNEDFTAAWQRNEAASRVNDYAVTIDDWKLHAHPQSLATVLGPGLLKRMGVPSISPAFEAALSLNQEQRTPEQHAQIAAFADRAHSRSLLPEVTKQVTAWKKSGNNVSFSNALPKEIWQRLGIDNPHESDHVHAYGYAIMTPEAQRTPEQQMLVRTLFDATQAHAATDTTQDRSELAALQKLHEVTVGTSVASFKQDANDWTKINGAGGKGYQDLIQKILTFFRGDELEDTVNSDGSTKHGLFTRASQYQLFPEFPQQHAVDAMDQAIATGKSKDKSGVLLSWWDAWRAPSVADHTTGELKYLVPPELTKENASRWNLPIGLRALQHLGSHLLGTRPKDSMGGGKDNPELEKLRQKLAIPGREALVESMTGGVRNERQYDRSTHAGSDVEGHIGGLKSEHPNVWDTKRPTSPEELAAVLAKRANRPDIDERYRATADTEENRQKAKYAAGASHQAKITAGEWQANGAPPKAARLTAGSGIAEGEQDFWDRTHGQSTSIPTSEVLPANWDPFASFDHRSSADQAQLDAEGQDVMAYYTAEQATSVAKQAVTNEEIAGRQRQLTPEQRSIALETPWQAVGMQKRDWEAAQVMPKDGYRKYRQDVTSHAAVLDQILALQSLPEQEQFLDALQARRRSTQQALIGRGIDTVDATRYAHEQPSWLLEALAAEHGKRADRLLVNPALPPVGSILAPGAMLNRLSGAGEEQGFVTYGAQAQPHTLISGAHALGMTVEQFAQQHPQRFQQHVHDPDVVGFAQNGATGLSPATMAALTGKSMLHMDRQGGSFFAESYQKTPEGLHRRQATPLYALMPMQEHVFAGEHEHPAHPYPGGTGTGQGVWEDVDYHDAGLDPAMAEALAAGLPPDAAKEAAGKQRARNGQNVAEAIRQAMAPSTRRLRVGSGVQIDQSLSQYLSATARQSEHEQAFALLGQTEGDTHTINGFLPMRTTGAGSHHVRVDQTHLRQVATRPNFLGLLHTHPRAGLAEFSGADVEQGDQRAKLLWALTGRKQSIDAIHHPIGGIAAEEISFNEERLKSTRTHVPVQLRQAGQGLGLLGRLRAGSGIDDADRNMVPGMGTSSSGSMPTDAEQITTLLSGQQAVAGRMTPDEVLAHHRQFLSTDQQRMLDSQQHLVIGTGGGGTGKSHVTRLMIAKWLAEGVSPEDIAYVTFGSTLASDYGDALWGHKGADGEFEHGLLGSHATGVSVGTRASYGRRLLRDLYNDLPQLGDLDAIRKGTAAFGVTKAPEGPDSLGHIVPDDSWNIHIVSAAERHHMLMHGMRQRGLFHGIAPLAAGDTRGWDHDLKGQGNILRDLHSQGKKAEQLIGTLKGRYRMTPDLATQLTPQQLQDMNIKQTPQEVASIANVWRDYESQKATAYGGSATPGLDMDDLSWLPNTLLEQKENQANPHYQALGQRMYHAVAGRVKKLIVDEVPQLGAADYPVISALAAGANQVVTTGDHLQHIGGFRGAMQIASGHLRKIFARHGEAEVPAAETAEIHLDQNYRGNSTQSHLLNIVRRKLGLPEDYAVNADGTPASPGGAIHARRFQNQHGQNIWVVKQVQSLIAQGVDPAKIAVMAGTNVSGSLDHIRKLFEQASVPQAISKGYLDELRHNIERKAKGEGHPVSDEELTKYERLSQQNGVSLGTIHQSQGRQFSHVFALDNSVYAGKEHGHMPPTAAYLGSEEDRAEALRVSALPLSRAKMGQGQDGSFTPTYFLNGGNSDATQGGFTASPWLGHMATDILGEDGRVVQQLNQLGDLPSQAGSPASSLDTTMPSSNVGTPPEVPAGLPALLAQQQPTDAHRADARLARNGGLPNNMALRAVERLKEAPDEETAARIVSAIRLGHLPGHLAQPAIMTSREQAAKTNAAKAQDTQIDNLLANRPAPPAGLVSGMPGVPNQPIGANNLLINDTAIHHLKTQIQAERTRAKAAGELPNELGWHGYGTRDSQGNSIISHFLPAKGQGGAGHFNFADDTIAATFGPGMVAPLMTLHSHDASRHPNAPEGAYFSDEAMNPDHPETTDTHFMQEYGRQLHAQTGISSMHHGVVDAESLLGHGRSSFAFRQVRQESDSIHGKNDESTGFTQFLKTILGVPTHLAQALSQPGNPDMQHPQIPTVPVNIVGASDAFKQLLTQAMNPAELKSSGLGPMLPAGLVQSVLSATASTPVGSNTGPVPPGPSTPPGMGAGSGPPPPPDRTQYGVDDQGSIVPRGQGGQPLRGRVPPPPDTPLNRIIGAAGNLASAGWEASYAGTMLKAPLQNEMKTGPQYVRDIAQAANALPGHMNDVNYTKMDKVARQVADESKGVISLNDAAQGVQAVAHATGTADTASVRQINEIGKLLGLPASQIADSAAAMAATFGAPNSPQDMAQAAALTYTASGNDQLRFQEAQQAMTDVGPEARVLFGGSTVAAKEAQGLAMISQATNNGINAQDAGRGLQAMGNFMLHPNAQQQLAFGYMQGRAANPNGTLEQQVLGGIDATGNATPEAFQFEGQYRQQGLQLTQMQQQAQVSTETGVNVLGAQSALVGYQRAMGVLDLTKQQKNIDDQATILGLQADLLPKQQQLATLQLAQQGQTLSLQQGMLPLQETQLAQSQGLQRMQQGFQLSNAQWTQQVQVPLETASQDVGLANAQQSHDISQAQLNYNIAYNQALYGPPGQDMSRVAGLSAQTNRLVASQNPLLAEVAAQPLPGMAVYGLENQKFMEGQQYQKDQLVYGRSPLLAGLQFSSSIKHIDSQTAFYKTEQKLAADKFAFDTKNAQAQLDAQQRQLDATKALTKALEAHNIVTAGQGVASAEGSGALLTTTQALDSQRMELTKLQLTNAITNLALQGGILTASQTLASADLDARQAMLGFDQKALDLQVKMQPLQDQVLAQQQAYLDAQNKILPLQITALDLQQQASLKQIAGLPAFTTGVIPAPDMAAQINKDLAGMTPDQKMNLASTVSGGDKHALGAMMSWITDPQLLKDIQAQISGAAPDQVHQNFHLVDSKGGFGNDKADSIGADAGVNDLTGNNGQLNGLLEGVGGVSHWLHTTPGVAQAVGAGTIAAGAVGSVLSALAAPLLIGGFAGKVTRGIGTLFGHFRGGGGAVPEAAQAGLTTGSGVADLLGEGLTGLEGSGAAHLLGKAPFLGRALGAINPLARIWTAFQGVKTLGGMFGNDLNKNMTPTEKAQANWKDLLGFLPGGGALDQHFGLSQNLGKGEVNIEEGMSNLVGGAFSGIGGGTHSVVDALGGVKTDIDNWLKTLLKDVQGWPKAIGNAIGGAAHGLWDAFTGLLKHVFGGSIVEDWFTSVLTFVKTWPGLLGQKITDAAKDLYTHMTTLLQGASDLWGQWFGPTGTFQTTWDGLWGGLGATVDSAWKDLSSHIGDFFQNLGSFVSGKLKDLPGPVQAILGGMGIHLDSASPGSSVSAVAGASTTTLLKQNAKVTGQLMAANTTNQNLPGIDPGIYQSIANYAIGDTNNPAMQGTDWIDYCEKLAKTVLRQAGMSATSDAGTISETAADAARHYDSEGALAHNPIQDARTGALLYFTGGKKGAGHVAIKVGPDTMVGSDDNGVSYEQISTWLANNPSEHYLGALYATTLSGSGGSQGQGHGAGLTGPNDGGNATTGTTGDSAANAMLASGMSTNDPAVQAAIAAANTATTPAGTSLSAGDPTAPAASTGTIPAKKGGISILDGGAASYSAPFLNLANPQMLGLVSGQFAGVPKLAERSIATTLTLPKTEGAGKTGKSFHIEIHNIDVKGDITPQQADTIGQMVIKAFHQAVKDEFGDS